MISFRQYLSLPQVERRKLHHWFIFSILHVFSRSLFCNCSSQLWIFLFSLPFFRRFRKMWNFSPLIVVPHSKCFAFPSLFFSLLSIFLPFFFEAVCRDLKKIVISFLSLPWLQARLTLAPATQPTFSSHVFHTNPLRQQRASVRETTSTKKERKKRIFFSSVIRKEIFFLHDFISCSFWFSSFFCFSHGERNSVSNYAARRWAQLDSSCGLSVGWRKLMNEWALVLIVHQNQRQPHSWIKLQRWRASAMCLMGWHDDVIVEAGMWGWGGCDWLVIHRTRLSSFY